MFLTKIMCLKWGYSILKCEFAIKTIVLKGGTYELFVFLHFQKLNLFMSITA